MTLRDLVLRLRALWSPRRVERDLDDELSFHLEKETRKLTESGMDRAQAERLARARFGPVPLAADECRDARGTAFITALGRDLAYAFRTCLRVPMASLTIVTTVALGLALVTVVFTFYDISVLRVDDVRNPYELYGVVRATRQGASSWVPFTRSEFDALRRETHAFTDALAMVRAVPIRIDGRQARMTLVSDNFFQLLGVTPAFGRVLSPADEDRSGGRQAVVLSHKGWSKFFAGDRTAIGQSVSINGVPYEVIGVMPETFRGLSVGAPDGWLSLDLIGRFQPDLAGREQQARLDDVVGRLKPGASLESTRAALDAWIKIRAEPATRIPPVLELKPRRGTVSADTLEVFLTFTPIFFAFGLILLIGCSNVANLLLARGVARQREIGIRLSLGASRFRIVRQLLTESFLLAGVSAILGIVLSRLLMNGAIYAASSTLPNEIAEQIDLTAPAVDWRVLIFMLFGAALSTVLFGLAPALQATRLELVRTMRGEITRDARPRRARQALIALQVGASALLLISAGVFLRSALAAATLTPGVRTSDTLVLKGLNEPKRSQILDVLKRNPLVSDVAAASERPELSRASAVAANFSLVSPNYFRVFDIEILKGRGFTEDERTADSGIAVVTDTLARRLWPDADALGQVIRLEGEPARTVSVVGVIRKPASPFRFVQVFSFSDVYLPTSVDQDGTSLSLRVHGDPDQARTALLDALTRVDPGLGGLSTMRTMARMETYILELVFSVTMVLGALALFLTVSGLFSVLSYLVEQRRKEMGVRIALGAAKRDVLKLVLSQVLRPVLFGLVTGGGLAAAVAIVLLAMPWGAFLGSVIRVSDPLAYIGGATVIVMACTLASLIPAFRAARIDPIEMLRES